MHLPPLLGVNEGVPHPTLWYPTILGILVVVAAVGLFCGSIWLLLATNLGARLGFLVAAAGLSGFMVLLSLLWLTTASPLNTLKGRVPAWKSVESLGPDLTRSTIPVVRNAGTAATKVTPIEATNVKASVDATVVIPQGVGGAPAPPATKYATYQQTTDYLVSDTHEVGGGKRLKASWGGAWPWVHVSLHRERYAVATICPVDRQALKVPFGNPIPNPTCDKTKAVTNLVLERDLGSVRVPPFVVFCAASIVFTLTLLAMHWRERDEQEAAAAAARQPEPARGELEPAKV